MTLSDFCKTYLQAQGVQILASKAETRAIKERREPEYVAVIAEYERQ